MVKVVLFTDLDNTIIHGCRKYKSGDVCVEKDNSGKEIAYMGREVLKRFLEMQCGYGNILEIIPVTSRSEAEYLRIVNTGILKSSYAFIDNGAGLMEGGVRCTRGIWKNDSSAAYLNPYLHVLESLVDRLRLVDGCYYFGKIKNGTSVAFHKVLGKTACGSTVYLQRSADKLYLLTDKTSKGNAPKLVQKFCQEQGTGKVYIICAGDSVMDIPMAKWSDVAIFSDSVKPFYSNVLGNTYFMEDVGDNLVNSIIDRVCGVCRSIV